MFHAAFSIRILNSGPAGACNRNSPFLTRLAATEIAILLWIPPMHDREVAMRRFSVRGEGGYRVPAKRDRELGNTL